MSGAIMRGVICAILALSGLGCRSVYRFRCTSRPTGAGVLVGEQRLGATACRIKIPKRSELIQDGRIEFTFCLPDGRDAADSSFASDSQARSDRHRLSTALRAWASWEQGPACTPCSAGMRRVSAITRSLSMVFFR